MSVHTIVMRVSSDDYQHAHERTELTFDSHVRIIRRFFRTVIQQLETGCLVFAHTSNFNVVCCLFILEIYLFSIFFYLSTTAKAPQILL